MLKILHHHLAPEVSHGRRQPQYRGPSQRRTTLPPVPGVHRPGKRKRPGRLPTGRRRLRRVLGELGRGASLVRKVGQGSTVGPALRPVVPGRQDQHFLQLFGPSPGRPAPQQGRHRVGGRAGRLEGLYLRRPAPGSLPLCQRTEEPWGEEGRQGNDLHAHDTGACHCHARLHPHRRAPQHRFWRLQP